MSTMSMAVAQKPRFLIGHFEKGLNRKNGKEQFCLETFFGGCQTRFVTDLTGPVPQNGQVWLFQPGRQIFLSDNDDRQIMVANLKLAISDEQKITLLFTPSQRQAEGWESAEQKNGLTVKYVPDRASDCFPSEDNNCRRFRGEIQRLVYYDHSRGFAIISVRLTEPAPTPTALRHSHNPAHAKKLAELEAERQKKMMAAANRRANAEAERAERGKGGKKKVKDKK